MAAVQIVSWLIAGSIASWLIYTLAGVGRLGGAVDWLPGPAGALLAGWLFALITAWRDQQLTLPPHPTAALLVGWLFGLLTGRPVEALDWWLSIPVAFAGALAAISLLRVLMRVRPAA